MTLDLRKLTCPDIRKDPFLHFEYEVYPDILLDDLDIEYTKWQTILVDNGYLALVILVDACRWKFTRLYNEMRNCDHDGLPAIGCLEYDHLRNDMDDIMLSTRLNLCPVKSLVIVEAVG